MLVQFDKRNLLVKSAPLPGCVFFMLNSSDYNTKELSAEDMENKLADASKDELKEELEARDLKVSGSKDELIDRLVADEKTDTDSNNTRTYTFTADGTQIEADNYQDALDKYNS